MIFNEFNNEFKVPLGMILWGFLISDADSNY